MDPLVSIISPSFNKDKYISEMIYSVLNQTYTSWELILVDDHSTDSTVNIINSAIEKDNRIKLYINPENKGANYSRNFGIGKATGKYIILLDSDDVLLADCLQNRVRRIANTNFDFCVFSMGTFCNKIGDNKSLWRPNSKQPLKDFLQHQLPWSILQPIWLREFLLKNEGFDENFDRLQDVEFHTRVLININVKYNQFPQILDCYYRIDDLRKNFNSFDFLKRWMNSSAMFCDKFENKIPKELKRFLYGTIFQSHLQIIYHFKHHKINKDQYDKLQSILFSCNLYSQTNNFKKNILKFSYLYNLKRFRISGINKILSFLITS